MTTAMRIGIMGIIILGIIVTATARGDLVDRLLPVVVMAESSGNPKAVGDGSYGLHQISPVTLAHFNQVNNATYQKRDLFNPEVSEEIARWYLTWINSYLSARGYPNDIPRIIFSYNSGAGRLRENNFQLPDWVYRHPNRIYRTIYINGGLTEDLITVARR